MTNKENNEFDNQSDFQKGFQKVMESAKQAFCDHKSLKSTLSLNWKNFKKFHIESQTSIKTLISTDIEPFSDLLKETYQESHLVSDVTSYCSSKRFLLHLICVMPFTLY